MAVIVKDVKEFPKDAPTELLLEKHVDFLASYGKGETHYEYVMAEFLRINGVYWSNTALCLMGASEKLDTKEVSKQISSNLRPNPLFLCLAETEPKRKLHLYFLSFNFLDFFSTP